MVEDSEIINILPGYQRQIVGNYAFRLVIHKVKDNRLSFFM